MVNKKYKNYSSDFIKFNKKPLKKNKRASRILKIFFFSCFSLFFVLCIAVGIFVYVKIIKPLPDVRDLQNLNLAKSSIIYDRNGNELYRLYKENRTYVNYENISSNMINALIAGEDQNFLKNSGVDFKRMVGAVFYYVIGQSDEIQGTSTITQQLIRNTIIENRSSQETMTEKVERKIKEVYLSYKLSSSLSKKKIIELYLNKIDFGSNSYGIEEASKTFFGKPSYDLSVLQSAILASLPKGPTHYSPYTHPDRLLGYVYYYPKEDVNKEDKEKNITKIVTSTDVETYPEQVKLIKDYIKQMTFQKVSQNSIAICELDKTKHKTNISIDSDNCSHQQIDNLENFLNSIRITYNDLYYVEYQTGRKDYILKRMYEDSYIGSFDEFRTAVLDGIGLKFNKNVERINAAHFVMYVKEYLEEKYGSDFITSGGLKIYTTLDPDLQKKAEELIESYGQINETKFGARNGALVSIDNESGQILAMVGGRDYFDEENDGNVNVATSRIQPGSSFKPFIYANAIDKNTIGSKTPVFDLKTTFRGNYTPSNFDGSFMGLMNISTALNSSRNVPAVKMVYLGGGESEVVNYLKNFGFTSIADDGRYGGSIGLGTAEVSPLEMASAYTVFANMGKKKEITPIYRIEDSKGLIVEEAKITEGIQVIDSAVAYIMNYILSDTSTKPSTRLKYTTITGRKISAKTGTSSKQYTINGKKVILPRNLWLAGYTPQITTVVWVGNTDGKETKSNASGLEAAGPIWRDFMQYAHENKEVMFWTRPSEVKEVLISRLTGNPIQGGAGSETDISLFKNVPTGSGSGLKVIKVDALCNGKVTELTPVSAIRDVYTIDYDSLMVYNEDWSDPVRARLSGGGYKGLFENYIDPNDIIIDKPCDREENPNVGNISIASYFKTKKLQNGDNEIEIAYSSDSKIIRFDILLDGAKIDELVIAGKKEGVYRGKITIPNEYLGTYNLTVRAVNDKYYSSDEVKQVEVVGELGADDILENEGEDSGDIGDSGNNDNSETESSSSNKIVLEITNPASLSIKLYPFQEFNLRGKITTTAETSTVNISVDGTHLTTLILDSNQFVYSFSTSGLTTGIHTIKVEVVDSNKKKDVKTIELEIL